MGKPKAKERKKKKEKRVKKNKHSFTWDDSQDLNGQLRRLGLCTKEITGDGNCLFRSLSDQYFGKDSHHKAIRQEICQFLEENKEEYMFFVEDDIPFEQHVASMKHDGTFGGNMELAAFAKLKNIDIKVYQPGLIYIINGTDSQDNEEEEEEKRILHIAYHSWEHYSSIRNIDGPATGLPEIRTNKIMEEEEEEERDDDDDDKEDPIDKERDSKAKVISSLFPSLSRARIKRLLIKNKEDVDKIINQLYEEEAKKAEEEGKEEEKDEKKKKSNTEKSPEKDINSVDSIADLTIESKHIEAPTQSLTVNTKMNGNDTLEKESIQPKEEDSQEAFNTDNATKRNDDMEEDKNKKEDKSTEITKQEEPPVKEEEIPKTPPKKPTPRQRKLESKKRQKELQLKKKQEKAQRKAQRMQNKLTSEDDNDDDKKETKQLSSTMKELYI